MAPLLFSFCPKLPYIGLARQPLFLRLRHNSLFESVSSERHATGKPKNCILERRILSLDHFELEWRGRRYLMEVYEEPDDGARGILPIE